MIQEKMYMNTITGSVDSRDGWGEDFNNSLIEVQRVGVFCHPMDDLLMAIGGILPFLADEEINKLENEDPVLWLINSRKFVSEESWQQNVNSDLRNDLEVEENLRIRELLAYLKYNTEYDRDDQTEENQVVLWCRSFDQEWSICYQNGGDDNGDKLGVPVFNNSGADCGLRDLDRLLMSMPIFSEILITEDDRDAFIYLVCKSYVKDEQLHTFF